MPDILINLQYGSYFGKFALIIASSLIFLIGFIMGKLMAKKNNAELLKTERRDAVKRSRAVLNGQLGEQIAPFLPDFPADPTEVRFIGKPVDYIAFNGVSEGHICDITFIEIKTGSASLTAVERSLKTAVSAGKVTYKEYYIH